MRNMLQQVQYLATRVLSTQNLVLKMAQIPLFPLSIFLRVSRSGNTNLELAKERLLINVANKYIWKHVLGWNPVPR